jgi:hypothetical protein
LFGGAAAVAILAERLALRLAGRGRGAARLELMVAGDRGERSIPIAPAVAASSQSALAELIAPQIDEAPGAVTRLQVVVVGESIAGVGSEAIDGEAAPPIDALSAALSSAGAKLAASQAERDGVGSADRSLPWQLSAPQTLRAERRDAHRRTRRAKRRRTVTIGQSLLFGQRDG